jgi:hypothetical protein
MLYEYDIFLKDRELKITEYIETVRFQSKIGATNYLHLLWLETGLLFSASLKRVIASTKTRGASIGNIKKRKVLSSRRNRLRKAE